MIERQLTPREMELLSILQEECAEVIQIISKIRRFGIDSYNPYDTDRATNQDLLNLEVGDVLAIIDMIKAQDNPTLLEEKLQARIEHKKVKVLKYLRT